MLNKEMLLQTAKNYIEITIEVTYDSLSGANSRLDLDFYYINGIFSGEILENFGSAFVNSTTPYKKSTIRIPKIFKSGGPFENSLRLEGASRIEEIYNCEITTMGYWEGNNAIWNIQDKAYIKMTTHDS